MSRDNSGLRKRTLARRAFAWHKPHAMFLDPNDKRLVDHFGLAAVLDVSPEKVKALHRAGVLPAYQTGPKQLRFDVEECLARLRVDAPSTAKAAS
jgi:hypothetical protein